MESVLGDKRSSLVQDDGNVSIAEIDGATMRLKPEGPCSWCLSSIMTMKIDLERRLLERIEDCKHVVQVEAQGPELTVPST